MKIRTKEDFQDLLDKDMGWRKKELYFIKSNIKNGTPHFKTHLRSGIVLLYAHWEGFIKRSCELYISYIRGKGLKFEELKENFIALALKNNLNNFEETNKSTIHCQIVDLLLNKLNQKANIPNTEVIQTGSNLNSTVLKEILTTVGLDFDEYMLKSNLLDSQLLKNRNSIAHGEYIVLDELDFNHLFEEVVSLMDDVKTKLINAVVLEEYKR